MTQAMETVIKNSILVEAPAERRKPRRLRRRAGLWRTPRPAGSRKRAGAVLYAPRAAARSRVRAAAAWGT